MSVQVHVDKQAEIEVRTHLENHERATFVVVEFRRDYESIKLYLDPVTVEALAKALENRDD